MRTDTLHLSDDSARSLALYAAIEGLITRDPLLRTVCLDITAWLGAPDLLSLRMPAGARRVSEAALADLVDGLTADTPALDQVLRDLSRYLRASRPPVPAPPPSPPPPPVVTPLDSADLLAASIPPWLPGTLGAVNPAFASALAARLGPRDTLILANLALVPEQLRRTGFDARDTALWFWLSRGFAGGAWVPARPEDDDQGAFLYDHLAALTGAWQAYLDVALGALRAAPEASLLLVAHDGPDRCGRTLRESIWAACPEDLRPRITPDDGSIVPD